MMEILVSWRHPKEAPRGTSDVRFLGRVGAKGCHCVGSKRPRRHQKRDAKLNKGPGGAWVGSVPKASHVSAKGSDTLAPKAATH